MIKLTILLEGTMNHFKEKIQIILKRMKNACTLVFKGEIDNEFIVDALRWHYSELSRDMCYDSAAKVRAAIPIVQLGLPLPKTDAEIMKQSSYIIRKSIPKN